MTFRWVACVVLLALGAVDVQAQWFPWWRPRPAPQGPETAHLWVDTDGGTCTRNGSPASYADASACASVSAATSAATSGDTIRVKTGTYTATQGTAGDGSKTLTFLCEASAEFDSGATNPNYSTLNFSGPVTIDGCSVTGQFPIVQFLAGSGSTWKNASMTGTGIRTCSSDEPILIQSGGPDIEANKISNVTLENITIGQFKGCSFPDCDCGGSQGFHLEQIRIGRQVENVLLDRVTFSECPNGAGFDGCGSGQIFITTPDGTTADPTDINIRNSVFDNAVNYHIQVHTNVQLANSTWAYTTFSAHEPVDWGGTPTSVTMVGNLGTRPQNCTSGVTYTKNVWQWSAGTPCGTDTRVQGDNFSTDQLGINATTLRLDAGSPAIDAGEATCASTANGEDIDEDSRPAGSGCDAGADERS